MPFFVVRRLLRINFVNARNDEFTAREVHTPAREVLSGCLKEFINRNENKTKRVKIHRLSLFFRQPEKM
ncbi:MAG: hypothetical protein IJV35_06525 [Neisseriaceae bacterium]|nr:hypothetical protein [Neisseriaceae bacterium]